MRAEGAPDFFWGVYQCENGKKVRAEGAPENFWGGNGFSKGKTLRTYFLQKKIKTQIAIFPEIFQKNKTPGYFFRDPNLRKITPDDFPGFQTLK